MVASAAFGEFLREMLAPLGPVGLRRMFGKTGVFCDGVMLGIVADNVLYLRVDEGNRVAFAEAADEVCGDSRVGCWNGCGWHPGRLFDCEGEINEGENAGCGGALEIAAGSAAHALGGREAGWCADDWPGAGGAGPECG